MTLNISKNEDTNKLINNVVNDLKGFADKMTGRVKRLTDIGIALSSQGQTLKLMEMIVDEARRFANADGGALYIKTPDEKRLRFEIVQNDTLNTRMGGTSGKITWPEINLINDDGTKNHSNVSAYVALTGRAINIPDVYEAEGFDFTGTKTFDKSTKYRSRSMLVVPLRDHEDKIIGVLQLINAQSIIDSTVIPFSSESQDFTLSFASQAAIVMTKNRLLEELENLFNAFILAIAKAIDEKSPYTGGHVKRVAGITMLIANRICKIKDGPFANVSFSQDELKELQLAAWMHDIGKVTTPEYVVDKATKLETIYDRINEVQTRFELFKRDAEINFLRKKLKLVESGDLDKVEKYEKEYSKELENIEADLAFLAQVNIGGEFMAPEKIQRVKDIAKKSWGKNGETLPWLSENEVYNLTIKKGTLTDEERKKIQEHVRLTEVMLNELPFPTKLKNVPKYASAHHETLIGTGYPHGLKGDELSLKARIIAFADIFEALSASDRPYREGKKASEVKKIIGFMIKDSHLDKDVAEMFFDEDIFVKYMKENYKPYQIDI
ncbi:MAG: HD-GYP domain-containing protein [Candidatus Anammoxibacter sp.]